MLGFVIKEHLDNNGIKYSHIAEKIGVQNPVFSAMLNGKRKITTEEFFSICDVLELDPNYFYNKLKHAS